MIRIQQEQLNKISHSDTCSFVAQMRKETSDLVVSPHQHFSDLTPETAAQPSPGDGTTGEDQDTVSQLVIEAQRMGLMGKSAIRLYVHYMLRVAPTGADMGLHGIVMKSLANSEISEEEKAELLDAELMFAAIGNTA